MYDDPNFDPPPARKTPSNEPPGAPFTPGGSPWSAPLSPDHAPGSGPYDPESSPWGSTPYGSPMPGYVPPPPPGRRPPGTTSPQQRRWRGLLLLLLVALLTFVGIGAAILWPHLGSSTTSTPNGPVAVATDKPTATATLKPGQTPLPTRIPTATQIPQPTALPGQPTPTPLPTATPIPYASHASVTFTRASQNISVPSSISATVGGAVPVTVESASNVAGSATETQDETAAKPAIYALTVHNNANFSATSSGATIHSTGGIACVLQSSLTIPAHSNGATTQDCITAPGAQPANVSFNNTTDNPPFVYTGGPFPAGGADEFWTVPSDCETNTQNVSDAHAAGANAVQAQLTAQVPGGSNVFSPASFTYSSLTCTPIAGTQTTTTTQQTYTVSLTASGSQASYRPSDAISYQASQLQGKASATNPKGSWQLLTSLNHICSSPTPGTHTTTSINLSCTASGTIAWIWSTSSASSTISPLITGEPKSAAISTVNAVPGVKPGSASISLTGGSYVPQGASQIGYIIITP